LNPKNSPAQLTRHWHAFERHGPGEMLRALLGLLHADVVADPVENAGELETWLSAKRVRDAREAKEAEEAAGELARRETEAETRRAAARAARRSRSRGQRPNHLRSVE
jgi:hypothetical protein